MKGINRKIIYFGEPDIDDRERRAVDRVLRSRWIGFGQESIKFEKELLSYVGARYGYLVSSCTAALHMALLINGVGPGDEVITTPLTFAATANTILYVGAKPVFVDIDPGTLNIYPDKIESAITPNTKCILVVHFGGLPCDMRRINSIAKKRKLVVIEDAAHAIGAEVAGKMVGNSQNTVCFSFYANKNLTSVEGGFIASNDPKIKRATLLRLHGLNNNAWKRFSDKSTLTTEVIELGYKYNITDVQSAIGRVQLSKFAHNQKKREQYAALYDHALENIKGIHLQPRNAKNSKHALHLYTIVIEPEHFSVSQDNIVMELRSLGIFAVVHYRPLHEQEFFRRNAKQSGKLEMASRVGDNILTLPLLPHHSRSEAIFIAKETARVLKQFSK